MTRQLSVALNTLGIFGIALMLAAAFTIQLVRGDCPARSVCCNASCSRCWPSVLS